MSFNDEKYMLQALALARRGIGSVEPNPAVGAVLVKDGAVVGKGWHKKFGGPHAEVNALEDCRKNGHDPNGASMYVTLEPCCHHGKTSPCTEAIVKAGIGKVFVAVVDPSPHAGGKGIELLEQADVEVDVGSCERQAKLLNAPFFKFASTTQPWVIVKWAQSIDGKLAWSPGSEKRWISNEKSRKSAHKLRRRTQGILVGINTVLADDPLLTPRPARGKKPLRIVLDNELKIPLDCQLVKTANKYPLVIYTGERSVKSNPDKVKQLEKHQCKVWFYSNECESNLRDLMTRLGAEGIQQLLVEGGPKVIASFIKANLTDEFNIYIAPVLLGSKGTADITEPMNRLNEDIDLHHVEIKKLDGDLFIRGLTKAI